MFKTEPSVKGMPVKSTFNTASVIETAPFIEYAPIDLVLSISVKPISSVINDV